MIPDDWFIPFVEEGEELLRKVRQYVPQPDDQRDVRNLLLADPYPAGSAALRRTAMERIQREDVAKPWDSWDEKVGLDTWCRRLAFPMLTASEIQEAMDNTTWRWLPRKRLGMADDYDLSKRLTKAKQTK